MRPRPFTLLLLFTLLLGCDDGPPPGTSESPGRLEGLVPADTCVLVWLRSPRSLDHDLQGLLRRTRLAPLANIPGATARGLLGDLQPHLDEWSPVAFALSLPRQADKPFTVTRIAGVRSPERVADELENARILGHYAALSDGATRLPAETGSRMLADFPRGDLVIRLDLARLIERYGADLTDILEKVARDLTRASGQLQGDDAPSEEQRPAETDAETPWGIPVLLRHLLESALSSCERLDVAADLDGGQVRLDAHLDLREGSPLLPRSGLGPLSDSMRRAARVLEQRDLGLAAALGVSPLVEQLLRMLEGEGPLPAGQARALDRLRTALDEHLTGVIAASLSVTQAGPHGVVILGTSNELAVVQALGAAVREASANLPGLDELGIEGTGDARLLGFKARGASRAEDALTRALLGSGDLAVRYAAASGFVVFGVGAARNDVASLVGRLERRRSGKRTNVRRLLQRAGSQPLAALDVDLTRLAEVAVHADESLERLRPRPGARPARLGIYVGSDRRRWRLGLRVPARDLKRAFQLR